jgi:predicted dehydrogenase
MTVNAGAISPAHWAQDREVGGGRIIGEGCHFIDLLRFLAGAPISSIRAMSTGRMAGGATPADVATFSMSFGDGSFGTVHYLANGHKSFPKERLEVFCAGRILQLDNFRTLKGFGWPDFSKTRFWRQDKGNHACVTAFVEAIRQGKPSPIPVDELLEVTRATFDIVDLLG